MNKKNKISFHLEIEPITSVLLIIATILALYISNSSHSYWYKNLFFNTYIVKNFNLHSFVNDFLMSIFFLLAGLEIKEEILKLIEFETKSKNLIYNFEV